MKKSSYQKLKDQIAKLRKDIRVLVKDEHSLQADGLRSRYSLSYDIEEQYMLGEIPTVNTQGKKLEYIPIGNGIFDLKNKPGVNHHLEGQAADGINKSIENIKYVHNNEVIEIPKYVNLNGDIFFYNKVGYQHFKSRRYISWEIRDGKMFSISMNYNRNIYHNVELFPATEKQFNDFKNN